MQLNFEIWLDNHLSPIIAKWLTNDLGIIVKSSYTLKLSLLTDSEIYKKAKEYGNVIIVSKDCDLVDIITIYGTPPNLIYLKIGNCDNKILFQILKKEIPKAIKLIQDYNKDIIEIQYKYE